MPKKGAIVVDMTGLRFGRLVVIEFSHRENRAAYWKCQCDCGLTTVKRGASLGRYVNSCGCLKVESMRESGRRRKRHGHCYPSPSPEYMSWRAMRQRVLRPSNKHDKANYKDRGITICERWDLFENFLEDMGPRPPGTTIDRIDNDGNYEPGNCRWATPKQQYENSREPSKRGRPKGSKGKPKVPKRARDRW